MINVVLALGVVEHERAYASKGGTSCAPKGDNSNNLINSLFDIIYFDRFIVVVIINTIMDIKGEHVYPKHSNIRVSLDMILLTMNWLLSLFSRVSSKATMSSETS